jgi:pimeloyl-ACP methyl ester carboxylesterase
LKGVMKRSLLCAAAAPSGDYSKQQQGRRLLAALDALHLGKVTIVAHSIGAAPVMEAVFRHPSQFTGLVLVDPALGLDAPQTDGSDTRLQAALRHAWIARPLGASLTSPLLTTSLLRRVISEKDRATPDWVRIYQRPLELRGASAAIGQWLPEVIGNRGRQLSDNPLAYTALKIPVTLIWGVTDTITPLAQGIHLQQLIPGAQLQLIPRAGHGPQFEEPALFSAALMRALSQ